MRRFALLLGLAIPLLALVGYALLGGFTARPAAASGCATTGFFRDSINMTAAMINPSGVVNGTVNATGCNIGVYYGPGHSGTIDHATIAGANYFGVVNDGGDVKIKKSSIHDIGESPLNGSQHGVGVYFVYGSAATGSITDNQMWNYQKGGIVVNGTGSSAMVSGNTVTGQGPVNYIAQNGIQIGYGATASVMRNTVTGNAYTGSSTVSGGIIVVGGSAYAADLTVGVQIVGNTVRNNDVGVYLTNVDAATTTGAPTIATNVKVINNTISNDAVTNGYVYQAGISDVGNNDKIINNAISGAGYADNAPMTYAIDADPTSYSPKVKVHANSTN